MRENSISNISIFDFIDDIDAFIDEWYEFHEETYQDSIPLNSFLPFDKMEYLRLNFNTLRMVEESTIESLSININEVLESINEKNNNGIFFDKPDLEVIKRLDKIFGGNNNEL